MIPLQEFFLLSGYLLYVLILYFAIKERKNPNAVIYFFFVVLFSFLLKFIFMEERPCAGSPWCPKNPSFPSNHAMISMALAFIVNEPWFYVAAIFCGISRIFAKVHYVHDVFFGFVFGVILGLIYKSFVKKEQKANEEK